MYREVIGVLVALDGMERAGHRLRALVLAMRCEAFAVLYGRAVAMKLITSDGRLTGLGRLILDSVD